MDIRLCGTSERTYNCEGSYCITSRIICTINFSWLLNSSARDDYYVAINATLK